MSNGDASRYIGGKWKFSTIFLLLSFSTVEAFHYFKLKKLITAYAVAKAFSGRRPSTTVIPIPIPIPIPVQQNEIIRVPSQSAGKAYVASIGGVPGGISNSHLGGSTYKITTLKGTGSNLNRLNGEEGVVGLSGDAEHSIGGLTALGGSLPNIIYTTGGGPTFGGGGRTSIGYGKYRNFAPGYEVDYQQEFAPSNVYRDRKMRGYRTPYPSRGRRIRSHKYYDFPDDSEQWVRSRRSRRCHTRSRCSRRTASDGGPIPVGEVYGSRY